MSYDTTISAIFSSSQMSQSRNRYQVTSPVCKWTVVQKYLAQSYEAETLYIVYGVGRSHHTGIIQQSDLCGSTLRFKFTQLCGQTSFAYFLHKCSLILFTILLLRPVRHNYNNIIICYNIVVVGTCIQPHGSCCIIRCSNIIFFYSVCHKLLFVNNIVVLSC